jgi:hypothetical protein
MSSPTTTKAHTDLTHAELVAFFSTTYMTAHKEQVAQAVGPERMKAVMEEIFANRQGITVAEYREQEQQRITQLCQAEAAAEAARHAARNRPHANSVRLAFSRMALAVANLI